MDKIVMHVGVDEGDVFAYFIGTAKNKSKFRELVEQYVKQNYKWLLDEYAMEEVLSWCGDELLLDGFWDGGTCKFMMIDVEKG